MLLKWMLALLECVWWGRYGDTRRGNVSFTWGIQLHL